jgi:hypothetical protein
MCARVCACAGLLPPGPPVTVLRARSGVIIRAALRQPRLYSYRDRFHSLILLASPSLGVLFSVSALVETGTYVVKKLRRCASLEQLACTDAPGNPSGAWLPRMMSGAAPDGSPGHLPSAGAVLSCFRHVMLCSSTADAYSPFFSCRAEMCEDARRVRAAAAWRRRRSGCAFVRVSAERGCARRVAQDAALGPVYANLARFFWEGVDARRVIKLDVDFSVSARCSHSLSLFGLIFAALSDCDPSSSWAACPLTR